MELVWAAHAAIPVAAYVAYLQRQVQSLLAGHVKQLNLLLNWTSANSGELGVKFQRLPGALSF